MKDTIEIFIALIILMGAYDFIPYLKCAFNTKCVEYKEWLTVQTKDKSGKA